MLWVYDRTVGAAWKAWSQFWFESPAPWQMRLFRAVFGSLVLVFYLIRTFDLEFYYSEKGLVPASTVADVFHVKAHWSLLNAFPSVGALWIFHILFILSLTCLTFGIWPRIAAVASFILHVSFLQRNMAIAYGIDIISTFFLLYLCFADYRLEARRQKTVASWLNGAMGSIAWRLCQIQICVIYAFAGIEKLKGTHWWRGEALWDVLANSQLARFDFSWISSFPLAIVAMTYSTLAWEIYFPALIWVKRARYPMLAFGVLLHIGIAVTVSIPFFGMLMIVAYALFLEPRHAAFLVNLPRRIFFRRRSEVNPQVPVACVDEYIV